MTGCLEDKDTQFINWLTDRVQTLQTMANLSLKLHSNEEYDKLENHAYMCYEKNLEWYKECQSFEVSPKWQDLKSRATMLFCYSYKMYYNLSMYARERANYNYADAYNYISNVSYWLDKAEEEAETIELILELNQ